MKKLGDLFEFINGRGFKKTEWKSDGLPIIRIQNLNNPNAGFNYFDGAYDKKIEVNAGDLLFSWSGTVGSSFGAHIWDRSKGVLNQHIFKLKFKENILRDYAFYGLRFITSDIEKKVNGAVGLVHITKEKLNKFEIPLPPLAEQQEIVSILDDAFESIERAKSNAEQNLKNAKELFDSYLQDIFENLGKDWKESTLGEIAFVKSGGTPSRSKKEYWHGEIAWYSSGELNNTYTINPERHINDLAITNSNAKLFPKGSLLIGMYDTAALKMSILDRDASFNQAIAGVKPNNKIDLIFILHSINSIKSELLNLRRGVRQKNLSLEKIKNIKIKLPPLKEQKKVVNKLGSLSIETKKLEFIYQQKLNDLEELKKSILQKAFNGELKTSKTSS